MTDNQPASDTKIDTGQEPKPAKKASKGSKKAQKSAARLFAVQAVYQILSNNSMKEIAQSPEEVVAEFIKHRPDGIDIDGDALITPDKELFKDITMGVFTHFEQLQEMVVANRAAGNENRAEKAIEPLLHALFLCGAFELMVHQSIDAPIIINDYLHAARAFYETSEVKLVNAVLDGVRETTR